MFKVILNVVRNHSVASNESWYFPGGKQQHVCPASRALRTCAKLEAGGRVNVSFHICLSVCLSVPSVWCWPQPESWLSRSSRWLLSMAELPVSRAPASTVVRPKVLKSETSNAVRLLNVWIRNPSTLLGSQFFLLLFRRGDLHCYSRASH